MENKDYVIRYLPLFYEDLESAVDYILSTLKNVKAANDLVDEVEDAIAKISYVAEAPEVFKSKHERRYPYRRIYVKNFVIYYVVIGDSYPKVMEIRRFLYSGRNRDYEI